ncbi:MAG TPA: LuxR C-terminal-related transcriptional regulator, partial [Anaerolineae bacterium]|nr:LuxR C-terminal-related transcriptional regulator [Anaerolineae bacterium]
MSNLLATKLRRPALSPKRVHRSHLIQRLNDGLEAGRPVTLVSAPAGFGKTTCIGDWVNTLDLPAAWLSLDPADDDPGRFFTYLIAALQQVDANTGREIEGILRAGQLPPDDVISTTLLNDLLEWKNRCLLILDDFQVIQDRFILHILEQLIITLPPALQLILITREDPSLPLARLRANNQLTEIRAADLRFTDRETDQFLNELLGLSLSRSDLTTLEDRTEGWIVGLQLAGLSMRGRADPSRFIANLSGSHRFILSYLTEEVLNHQPEDIQRFLLQTSILDRLNGDLCNAVTGQTNSHALLQQLFNANLFLIPLDDEGHWYRYHQLFADLLRERHITLLKDQTIELHRRASQWYVQAGLVREAVEHALAATDYATAVHQIEDHAMDMLMEWHVKTVNGWMQAIPAEWCLHSPRANLAFAWLHMIRGAYDQAAPYLQRLHALFSDPPASEETADPALTAKWLAIQSMLLNAQGKPDESVALGRRALEIAPEDDVRVRSLIYLGLAGAYQQWDDYDHTVEAYQTLIRYGQTTTNSVSELLGSSALALLAIERGQLHFAFDLVSQTIERVERSGSLPPITTAVYGELGVIHYQWHQLDQAHHYFRRAIQVSALSGYSDAELFYGVILSRLFQIEGNLEAAARELQKAADLMQVAAPMVVREEVIAQQVRIYLAQDRLAAAEALLTSHGFSFQDQFSFPALASRPNLRAVAVLYLSALRILLHRARVRRERANVKPGIELIDQLIAGALQHHSLLFAVEALLVRAQLQVAWGDEQAALADCAQAVELAEPEGLLSIFIEGGPPIAESLAALLKHDRLGAAQRIHVEKILAAFYASPPPDKVRPVPQPATAGEAESALIEPLTDRELDVLRSMAEGLKYEEIATRLFISVNTVRSHVKV